MHDGYVEIADFEDIVANAVSQFADSGQKYVINFTGRYKFAAIMLLTPQLVDVVAKAELWQSTKRPRTLHFSHGEYIGENGITNIAAELRRKQNSNRAIISLISQNHIIGSGDEPIPSFMSMQCGLEGSTLYVTVNYRALELSTFLRLNLEEIRIMVRRIYDELLNFEHVALSIIAFRGYVQLGMNTLERCRIDQLTPMEILKVVEKEPERLPDLLREKAAHTTTVATDSIEQLLEVFSNPRYEMDIPFAFNRDGLVRSIGMVLDASQRLTALRRRASHHADIDRVSTELAEMLLKLAKEVEACLSN
jgi:hypothetical protein